MAFKKEFKKTTLQIMHKSGLTRLLAGTGTNNFLTVLNYHRVDYPENRPWLDPSLISATPEQFEAQMRLLRQKYSPIGIEALLDTLINEKTLPRRAVLITVDDGYRDFQETIFPITSKYGIQPILFVPTAYPAGKEFWWDKLYWAVENQDKDEIETPYEKFNLATPAQREKTLRELRTKIKRGDFRKGMSLVDALYATSKPKVKSDTADTLEWDELRALARKGVIIAAHTHHHPLLTRIPFEEACDEIHQSLEIIKKEIAETSPIFAFPDGQPAFFSPELISFLKKEKIIFAVTTVDENASLTLENALFFPRIGVYRKLSLAAFEYRLTPFYTRK